VAVLAVSKECVLTVCHVVDYADTRRIGVFSELIGALGGLFWAGRYINTFVDPSQLLIDSAMPII
jgi:hypothetical protein